MFQRIYLWLFQNSKVVIPGNKWNLQAIYNAIKLEAFKFPDDLHERMPLVFQNVDKQGWLIKQGDPLNFDYIHGNFHYIHGHWAPLLSDPRKKKHRNRKNCEKNFKNMTRKIFRKQRVVHYIQWNTKNLCSCITPHYHAQNAALSFQFMYNVSMVVGGGQYTF